MKLSTSSFMDELNCNNFCHNDLKLLLLMVNILDPFEAMIYSLCCN